MSDTRFLVMLCAVLALAGTVYFVTGALARRVSLHFLRVRRAEVRTPPGVWVIDFAEMTALYGSNTNESGPPMIFEMRRLGDGRWECREHTREVEFQMAELSSMMESVDDPADEDYQRYARELEEYRSGRRPWASFDKPVEPAYQRFLRSYRAGLAALSVLLDVPTIWGWFEARSRSKYPFPKDWTVALFEGMPGPHSNPPFKDRPKSRITWFRNAVLAALFVFLSLLLGGSSEDGDSEETMPLRIKAVIAATVSVTGLAVYLFVELIYAPAKKRNKDFVLRLANQKNHCKPWDDRALKPYGDPAGWRDEADYQTWKAAAEAEWHCSHVPPCSEVQVVSWASDPNRVEIRYRGKRYITTY